MTPAQILALASSVSAYTQAGMVLIGGVKSLVSLFANAPTDAELDALVDALVADASRRKSERDTMTGA